MKRLLVVLLLMVASTSVQAYEKWDCTELFDTEVLVTAIESQPGQGTVTAMGTTHEAEVRVEGLKKAWLFGGFNKHDVFNYSLVIKPTGDAFYYDYTDAEEDKGVIPSMTFYCTVVSTVAPG